MRSTDWAMEECTKFQHFWKNFYAVLIFSIPDSVRFECTSALPTELWRNVSLKTLCLICQSWDFSIHEFYHINAWKPSISVKFHSDVESDCNTTDWAMEECKCWRLPIFTPRRQGTIFGTTELNFRVRYGNGWTLCVINTNYWCDRSVSILNAHKCGLIKLVTRAGIEPALPAWEAGVLTAWPTSRFY